ncbi:hypothetical protein, partial [Marinococcus sp. PL1-022]|uniref:hypothetical protein n=1 Tax=Marinococcus sp. PL1-022 TaxID=3095363 RepID=UPI0029C114E5
FGKMLYEAITLEKPYVLDYSKLPPEIQYIVRKCTEEDFTERFNSVKELRVKFTNAMDILLEGANHDWQSIIKKIHESEEKPSTIYSELAEALSQIEDDEEEKHEALMNITGNMYKVLFESYPDLVKKLMQDFTRFINSQSWPFSYTDTVGDKFLEIFSHINNAKIRILLIKSTLILSVSHNRWYVMGLFVNMLYEINNDEDIVYEVYHELSDKKYELDRISRNIIIKSERLHKVHKKLFDTNSG